MFYLALPDPPVRPVLSGRWCNTKRKTQNLTVWRWRLQNQKRLSTPRILQILHLNHLKKIQSSLLAEASDPKAFWSFWSCCVSSATCFLANWLIWSWLESLPFMCHFCTPQDLFWMLWVFWIMFLMLTGCNTPWVAPCISGSNASSVGCILDTCGLGSRVLGCGELRSLSSSCSSSPSIPSCLEFPIVSFSSLLFISICFRIFAGTGAPRIKVTSLSTLSKEGDVLVLQDGDRRQRILSRGVDGDVASPCTTATFPDTAAAIFERMGVVGGSAGLLAKDTTSSSMMLNCFIDIGVSGKESGENGACSSDWEDMALDALDDLH